MQGLVGIETLPAIAVITVVVACINILVMVGIGVVHPRQPGPSAWAMANAIFAAGVSILALRQPQNEPLIVLAGNSLVVAGYLAFWFGCTAFKRQPPPWRLAALILLLHGAGFAYALFIAGDPVLRAAITALTLTLCCVALAHTMLTRIEPGLLQSQAFIGLVFGVLAVLHLLRAIAVLSGGVREEGFISGPLGAGILLIPAASLLITAACTLMLTQRLQQRLQASPAGDPLTGLVNRGQLDELGTREVSRAQRHRYALTVVVFDLDHFAMLNQRLGFAAGDAALRDIARLVAGSLRREDVFARLDGASFCIMLPSTALAGAEQMAHRIRQQIAGIALSESGAPLTASFGLATLGLHGDDWIMLLQRAKTALQQAKTAGRDRVSIAALNQPRTEFPL